MLSRVVPYLRLDFCSLFTPTIMSLIPEILSTEPATIPALNEFCAHFERFVIKHRESPKLFDMIEAIVVSGCIAMVFNEQGLTLCIAKLH